MKEFIHRLIYVAGAQVPAENAPEGVEKSKNAKRAEATMARYLGPQADVANVSDDKGEEFEAADVVEKSEETIEAAKRYRHLYDLLSHPEPNGKTNESTEVTQSLNIPGVAKEDIQKAISRFKTKVEDESLYNLEVGYFPFFMENEETDGQLAICYQAKVEPHYRVFYRVDRPYHGDPAAPRKDY